MIVARLVARYEGKKPFQADALPSYGMFQIYSFITTRSCGCFNGGGTQLVHDNVHGVHVTSIGVGRVPFRQALAELGHGGLVVANGGREGVDGLLASGLVGV